VPENQYPEPLPPPVIEFRPDDIVTAFRNLPSEVTDLLIREAYMARAAEFLHDRQRENAAKRTEAQAKKPSFLMAWNKTAQKEYEQGMKAAEVEFEFFQKAIDQNEKAMANLRKSARRNLELWLREHDPSYIAGLVNEQFTGDWRNAINLVSDILDDFVRSLGEARNQMVTGYDRDRNAYSEGSLATLERAVKIGHALMNDMSSVNKIADDHDRSLAGTVYENPFPRLPLFDAEGHTAKAAARPIGALQAHFDRIKAYGEELANQGIPALVEAVRRAEERHRAIQESYMTSLWDGLRELARKEHVDEEKLETIVRETEERFLHGDYG
jgi:hypothetical protein